MRDTDPRRRPPPPPRYEYRVRERETMTRATWALDRRLIGRDGYEYSWHEQQVYRDRQRAENDAAELNAENAA